MLKNLLTEFYNNLDFKNEINALLDIEKYCSHKKFILVCK